MFVRKHTIATAVLTASLIIPWLQMEFAHNSALAASALSADQGMTPADQPATSVTTNSQPFEDSADQIDAITSTAKYTLEPVASFDDYMPRGVTVSQNGRIFVCFPRHEDNHEYTVAEIKDGKAVPFPNAEINEADFNNAKNHLISVISAVIDNKNRLWLLDSGRIGLKPVKDATKLIAVDLQSGEVVKNIPFPEEVLSSKSVLKDLRIDPLIGQDGTAIIGDSAPTGDSAILVTDLASGKTMRRLNKNPSVSAEPDFVIFADGEMVLLRTSEDNKVDWESGIAGLTISADGKFLYYSPMASLQIYSVSLEKLCDPHLTEADIEKTIAVIGREIGTSDGIESDSQNHIYLTDVENNTLWRRNPNGAIEKIIKDERLSWPDRLCLAPDGYLYVICSQFHRSPWFHYGEDQREKPYGLFRIKIGASPVQLK